MAYAVRRTRFLSRNPHTYFLRIAKARGILRRVFRIIAECARRHGVDSLEHQALVQIFGSPATELPVTRIAENLDISQPCASRLVRALARHGFVERRADRNDQRLTLVRITKSGRMVLRRIEGDVHLHVGYFGAQLTPEQRAAVASTIAFYVGLRAHFE